MRWLHGRLHARTSMRFKSVLDTWKARGWELPLVRWKVVSMDEISVA